MNERCPGCGERYSDCALSNASRHLAPQPPGPPLCDLCREELYLRRYHSMVSSGDALAMLARHLAYLARRIGGGYPAQPFWCQAADGNRGRCGLRARVQREGYWVCTRHAKPIYRCQTFWGLPKRESRPKRRFWLVCTNCAKSYETTERESKFCSHRCSAIVSNHTRKRSIESCNRTAAAVKKWHATHR